MGTSLQKQWVTWWAWFKIGVTMFAEYDDERHKIHVFFDEHDHISTMSDLLICIWYDVDCKPVNTDEIPYGEFVYGGNDYTYAPIELCDGTELIIDWNDLTILNETREVVISA